MDVCKHQQIGGKLFTLRHSLKITQAMIEIACMREWPGD